MRCFFPSFVLSFFSFFPVISLEIFSLTHPPPPFSYPFLLSLSFLLSPSPLCPYFLLISQDASSASINEEGESIVYQMNEEGESWDEGEDADSSEDSEEEEKRGEEKESEDVSVDEMDVDESDDSDDVDDDGEDESEEDGDNEEDDEDLGSEVDEDVDLDDPASISALLRRLDGSEVSSQ